MDTTLWISVSVLFGTALITALIKRYSKDPSLKFFNRCFVYIRLKTGKWIWGYLRVYANALELIYTEPVNLKGYGKSSYILYEQNLENIDRILRPSPAQGTPEHARWQREIEKLANPSLLWIARRRFRNIINLLRDAFAQAMVLIFGAWRKGRTFAAPVTDDKVGEMSRNLINVVPNAYEPILEKYLGRTVVVETVLSDKVVEQVGVLQEYTAKFILVRDAKFLADLPPFVENSLIDRNTLDVIFPRQTNSVRHLAEPSDLASELSSTDPRRK